MRISDWSSDVCSSDLTAIATTISLHDHLTAQAGARFKGADLLVAAHLIDLVDETGYLTDSVEDVADRLDASPAMVEAVLQIIQTFDSSRLGARSLADTTAKSRDGNEGVSTSRIRGAPSL